MATATKRSAEKAGRFMRFASVGLKPRSGKTTPRPASVTTSRCSVFTATAKSGKPATVLVVMTFRSSPRQSIAPTPGFSSRRSQRKASDRVTGSNSVMLR